MNVWFQVAIAVANALGSLIFVLMRWLVVRHLDRIDALETATHALAVELARIKEHLGLPPSVNDVLARAPAGHHRAGD